MAGAARDVVATGRTVDEAVASGAGQLGIRPEDADIEVLEEGAKGWLGLGAQRARVRVARPSKGSAASRFIQQLATILGMEVDVDVQSPESEGEPWQVAVATEDAGRWIGHRGQTLEALRVLCDAAATRSSGSRDRLVLDVGGYRERREQMLRSMAILAAQRAIRLGREIVLEPMSPADRRVVHLAVQEVAGAESQSRGEEPGRRVVVRPLPTAEV